MSEHEIDPFLAGIMNRDRDNGYPDTPGAASTAAEFVKTLDEPSGIGPAQIALQARIRQIPREREDSVLCYYRSDKAYYAPKDKSEEKRYVHEIMLTQTTVGGDHPFQGSYGELSIRWGYFDLSHMQQPWMQLRVFEDGLRVLVNHPEVLTALAALCHPGGEFFGKVAPVEQVEQMLQELGVRDITQYEQGKYGR